MDYKEDTKRVYDKYALVYERNTQGYLEQYLLNEAQLFIDSLLGKDILDLGSGPGRDSLFFKSRELNPVCVDISPSMIELCREKGLVAYEMDIENLSFEDSSFDGVWAYTSLLHLPKRVFPSVLKRLSQILKPRGVFFIGMKEGDFDGWIASSLYGNEGRFYVLYQSDELERFLSAHFDIIHRSQIQSRQDNYLNYLCRNRLSQVP